jgi:hypothetical protein
MPLFTWYPPYNSIGMTTTFISYSFTAISQNLQLSIFLLCQTNIYDYYLVKCGVEEVKDAINTTPILGYNIHCVAESSVKVNTCEGVYAIVYNSNDSTYDQPCILTSYWKNENSDTIQMTWSASTNWMQSGSSDIKFTIGTSQLTGKIMLLGANHTLN